MGIKEYNAPFLRRIGDLKAGTFFLWHHQFYIRLKVGDIDDCVFVCNLESGEVVSLCRSDIVSVVYEGVFRISTDKPDHTDKEGNIS